MSSLSKYDTIATIFGVDVPITLYFSGQSEDVAVGVPEGVEIEDHKIELYVLNKPLFETLKEEKKDE